MRFLLLLIAAVDALGAQKPRPEVTQLATAGPAFFSLYAGGIFPFTVATDSSGNPYIAGTVQSNIFAATAGAVQTQYAGGTCINDDPVPGELQNGRENRASALLRTWPRPSRTLG